MIVNTNYKLVNGVPSRVTVWKETDLDTGTKFVVRKVTTTIVPADEIAMIQARNVEVQAVLDENNANILTLQSL